MSNDNLQNEHADLQSLFQRTQPLETAVDVNRIISQNNELSQPAGSADSQRRRKMVSRTLVVLLVAAVVVLLLNLPQTSTEGVAFAQVQAQVEQVRTVDYVQTSLVVRDKELPKGTIDVRFGEETPESFLKKAIEELEKRLQSADKSERDDISFRLELLRPYLAPETPEVPDGVKRVRIKGKQLERTDDIFPFGQFHSIRNAQTGQHLMFDHSQKTKTLLGTQVVINRTTGERKEHPIKISPAADFFQRFRSIPEEATERLPGTEIGGQQVLGFRSVETHESGTWTRTFWVDEKTKLPVQIVTEFESEQQGLSSAKWIQDHFVFDAELDDALFDTKTPEGYTEKEDKIYGFE